MCKEQWLPQYAYFPEEPLSLNKLEQVIFECLTANYAWYSILALALLLTLIFFFGIQLWHQRQNKVLFKVLFCLMYDFVIFCRWRRGHWSRRRTHYIVHVKTVRSMKLIHVFRFFFFIKTLELEWRSLPYCYVKC